MRRLGDLWVCWTCSQSWEPGAGAVCLWLCGTSPADGAWHCSDSLSPVPCSLMSQGMKGKEPQEPPALVCAWASAEVELPALGLISLKCLLVLLCLFWAGINSRAPTVLTKHQGKGGACASNSLARFVIQLWTLCYDSDTSDLVLLIFQLFRGGTERFFCLSGAYKCNYYCFIVKNIWLLACLGTAS